MLVVDLRNTRINVYNYSVIGNKNSDIIYFYYPKKYQNYNVYVKVLGENIADKFRIYEPNIEVKDDCIRAKWIMSQSVTVNKEIQVQLEYDITLMGGSEIAQSKIVALKLQNTLDINGEIEPIYPSVLQELREDLDAEILHRQQGDTALHNEIVAENERAKNVESGLRTDLDNHTADKNNPHEVTKTQVGLGNVDNTSDQDKPVSTAQQEALDLKADKNTTYSKTETDNLLNDKVDKVTGKQLSTEDYTTAEKNKLANIESGAQVNVLEGVKVNNQPLTPTNKVVNIDLTSYAKINDMETYGKTLEVGINSSTYVMTFTLKDANGNTLTTQSVDLPLETMVVNGSYDSVNKAIILTLDNGNTITIPVADLVSGLVSTTDLATALASYYTKAETDETFATKEEAQKMVSVTYAELKALRDNGQLIPGKQYRITDYECVTKQFDTRSAMHPFDIIVTADDESHLNENARVCHSARDVIVTAIYSASYSEWYERKPEADGDYQGVHYYAYYTKRNGNYDIYVYTNSTNEKPKAESVFIFYVNGSAYSNIHGATPNAVLTFADEGETIDNYKGLYFSNSKLEAWEIKYCLDNNDTRFLWALSEQAITNLESSRGRGGVLLVRQPSYDNRNIDQTHSEYQYAWGTILDVNDGDEYDFIYSKNPTITENENVFVAHSGNLQEAHIINSGKGVIYYMKDEWGNECPYDFKNIQFKRYRVTLDTSECDEFDDKYVGYFDAFLNHYPNGYDINDDQDFVWFYTFTGRKAFWNDEDEEIVTPDDIDTSTTIYDLSLIDMSNWYNENEAPVGCEDNIIKDSCNHDLFTSDLVLNNIVFTGWFVDIGSLPQNYKDLYAENIFEMMNTPCGNHFDNNCSNMTFYDCCQNNIFGSDCQKMIFGNGCQENHFGSNNTEDLFGDWSVSNVFGNDNGGSVFSSGCSYNHFISGCWNNILISSSNNTFGNGCSSNNLSSSYHNRFNNGCSNNTMKNSQSNTFDENCNYNSLNTNCQSNHFGNNCSNISLGNSCIFNSFGNACAGISFGDSCDYNSFGNHCYNISFGVGTSTKKYFEYVKVEDCSNLNITAQTTSSNRVKNAVFSGFKGTNDNNRVTITALTNQDLVEYKPANAVVIVM